MSPGVGIQVNMNDVPEDIRELAERVEEAQPVLEDFGSRLVREMTKSFPQTSSGESSEPGNPPAVQSGDMKNSLTWDASDEEVEVGTPLVYGEIQHRGGTIEPDEADALTIPVSDEARGKRASDFSDLFFLPSTDQSEDNIIGVLGEGRGEDFEPIFALAEEVTLPERPWLIIKDDDWEYLRTRFREELEDVR